MSKGEGNIEKWTDILNLVESHLVDSKPRLCISNTLAQRFNFPKRYTNFHYPVLTASPPPTSTTLNPTSALFIVMRNDETISAKLFSDLFDWSEENVRHFDDETGGWVNHRWNNLIAAIVHPDSTIAYYKVHDGIHKPLEGLAGV